ncbi:MAG TPA: hypothetical protein VH143_00520 [Kofleriaceae bacterium]|nr:hypothetical protein [Kofleriaceae bacterium]
MLVFCGRRWLVAEREHLARLTRAACVLILFEQAHLRDLRRTGGYEIGIAIGIDTTTERESDEEQAKTKMHKPLGAGEATTL